MNQGQIIGFNDVLFNRVYTTSVRCCSSEGVVLMIKADEFIEKMQKLNMTWDFLLLNAWEKDQELKHHLAKAMGTTQKPQL